MVDFAKDQAFMDWLKGVILALIAGGTGEPIGPLRATAALAAGANNNLNPGGGWPTNYGRLFLTAAGAANLTGLVAGLDNQWVLIVNDDPVDNITLNSANAGSAAANQFDYAADLILPPLSTVIAVYDAPEAKWILT
jgi:hypothetical protein